MNETVNMSLPVQIIITIEGIIGTIFNIIAIIVVINVNFGSKFTTFIFRAQPIFDLSACLLTTIYYIIQFTENYNRSTGLYIIDILFCHFWFRNALFWLPCILSVQNLVCISLDRVSSIIFTGLYKSYSSRFFILYIIYVVSMVLILYTPTPLLRRFIDDHCVMDFSVPWMETKEFIDYFVYSWVILAYCVPVLVMLISHGWVIRTLRRTNSPHNCLSRNMESNLYIKRKISQLVITTATMSVQHTVLHFFENIVTVVQLNK
ncbi:amine GPCR [Schistosoma japonicum]|uniref:Amine GPCR n=1 Tax=Schistosoma japonicum TaxID=6182 RepID=A0A4Z2CWU9_SCHJA|nr:amine GPCR [Schistosoma japonicum]